MIFLSCNVVSLFAIYFLAVETRGRSLEELDEVCKASYPKQRVFARINAAEAQRKAVVAQV